MYKFNTLDLFSVPIFSSQQHRYNHFHRHRYPFDSHLLLLFIITVLFTIALASFKRTGVVQSAFLRATSMDIKNSNACMMCTNKQTIVRVLSIVTIICDKRTISQFFYHTNVTKTRISNR